MDASAASKLHPNAEQRANWLSRIFFCYMMPFFCKGARKKLQEEDMFQPLPEHDSKTATHRLQIAWENERRNARARNRPPSLQRAVLAVSGCRLASYGFWLFLEETIKLAQPVFMGLLIRYFRFDSPLSRQEAYIAASGVAITAALCAMVHHPYFHLLMKLGMEMKVATSGMIMEKGVRLSSGALHKTTLGHIVNLLSTDVAKLDMAFLFAHYIWVAPLMLAGYVALLWREIGPSCLAGFAAIVLLTPLQGYFSQKMGVCRRMIAQRTDKRISVMNEILNGIRVIKMYAWEGAFSTVIGHLRRKELSKVRELAIWQSLVMGTFWASGKLVVLFAVLSFLLTGHQLTAERIFVATALYNACRLPLTLFLPFGLQFLFEARVSLRRIQTFLELDEHGSGDFLSALEAVDEKKTTKKSAKSAKSDAKIRLLSNGDAEKDNLLEIQLNNAGAEKKSATAEAAAVPAEPASIEMKNFTAMWEPVTDEEVSPEDRREAIRNVNLTAKPGQLIAVIGAVGAGKSSLLSSILRETRIVAGSLTVSGRVVYASQDAWIFSGTVRQNILFGSEYDARKYGEALKLCALNEDISELPQGDLSMVGDRGASLSGGQKARISLARAVYRDADIYLLDDPLSAVDAAVGRYLFEKCIAGHLRSKIVVLITHQLQYLQRTDHILLLRNGDVVAAGTYAELRDTCADTFADIMQETAQQALSNRRTISTDSSGSAGLQIPRSPQKIIHEMVPEEVIGEADEPPKLSDSAWKLRNEAVEEKNTTGGGVGIAEERSEGAVEWRIYGKYIQAMSHPAICMLPLLVFVLFVQILQNVVDWWLNKWTNAAERTASPVNGTVDGSRIHLGPWWSIVPSLDDYRNIFTIMVLVLMVVSVLRCIWFRLAQIVASQKLHDGMFQSIIFAKMRFFDTNPIGRVLNRFSKDVGTMDENLSFVFFEFLMGTLNFIGIIVVIVALNPMVLLPTLPLLVIFWGLRVVYLASSRDVKRLEATTRSPLYSHISSTLNGLITVRAYGSEHQAVAAYHNYMNVNSAAFYLTFTASRWFAVCIDWLVAGFVAVVAFSCVLTPVMTSSAVGLTLVYAVSLIATLGRYLELMTRMEIAMVSVERIVNYSELESEEAKIKTTQQKEPPANWPNEGRIEFRNVSLKYDDAENSMALENVDFQIRAQEKVGIVGRTGAGKSSLLRALFRLTEPMGTILIDDIDTATVPLNILRKRLSIIPQDPVLFVGSLRENLDPFTEFSDQEIWDALKQVELKDAVQDLPEMLETPMQEGGANFSVGQRQLICLARAMLKRATILVIDEATANVDPETDSLIQVTIKSQFLGSTVLTIAHRLNTIMDSDRVMVLQNGRLIEMDHPHHLLSKPFSIFAGLVTETGDANAKKLRTLAEEAWRKKEANIGREVNEEKPEE